MNQKIAFYTHDDCLLHNAGEGHPESPKRLEAVLNGMKKAFSDCETNNVKWVDGNKGTKEQVLLVHDLSYWNKLNQLSSTLNIDSDPINIDEDTCLSHGSLSASLHGVGIACQAVDDVYNGLYRNGFCITRPPGHHAVKRHPH